MARERKIEGESEKGKKEKHNGEKVEYMDICHTSTTNPFKWYM